MIKPMKYLSSQLTQTWQTSKEPAHMLYLNYKGDCPRSCQARCLQVLPHLLTTTGSYTAGRQTCMQAK